MPRDERSDAAPDDRAPRQAAAGREAVAAAAWRLLGQHDDLARLGLSPAKLAREAHVAESTAAYHLSTGNVLDDLARRIVDDLTRTGNENSAEYQLASKLIPNLEGANATQIARQARRLLATVLRLDLDDGRDVERIWYALVAIADLDREALGKNVDLTARLQAAHDANQRAYESAYDAFCAITGRTYVDSRARTMRALNAYLEGVSVQARYGRGPESDEELIDVAVRIFWAHTKPLDGPVHDMDDELFGALAEAIVAGGSS